ncbi:MAG: hypothetical protein GY849_12520, partial [Deltaproteobacteria bacterium]|nr:hypothetical protein [Deltaproteobacteria bacterium]
MDTDKLLNNEKGRGAIIFFVISLCMMVGAVVLAWLVQRDFGRVDVSNVAYKNYNGIHIRAKLLRPVDASKDNPMPGVVYIHGYQNNRETGDAYCIEMAKRGFVVLNMDAIGRGNSGIPNDPDSPDFDETYGGRTSLAYIKSLPFVDANSVGMMGHSLGAEMAYMVALDDPSVRALVITGFAYTEAASESSPKNMLMIFGKWDEFRGRMTGTRDVEKEWMGTPQSRKVIPVENPELGITYGDFAKGTARRVFMPGTIHIQESHDSKAISEALEWMRKALLPSDQYWIDSHCQTWATKEWATLAAMIACLASLLPLGLMLLRTRFFAPLRGPVSKGYACSGKSYF